MDGIYGFDVWTHASRITNGPSASTLVVYAKTSPDKGSKGITAFIIENTFEGFSYVLFSRKAIVDTDPGRQ
jgi:alkylation response protein AidB-like acyl-CoA dehydrogenase